MSDTTQEIAVQPQLAPATPFSLIVAAQAKGASLEEIKAYMDLADRMEAKQAQNAFNVAFTAFKAESFTIIKNITVKDGPLKGQKYADLFGVCSALIPALAKHGLSHSWKLTKDDREWMEVTCYLRHAQGHTEAVAMGAAPDNGPGRNAIQARGSAKSYLERYTFLAVTGTAASGEDTDGNTGPSEAVKALAEDIYKSDTLETLQKTWHEAYAAAEKRKDKAAMTEYDKAREARLAELTAAEQEQFKALLAEHTTAEALNSLKQLMIDQPRFKQAAVAEAKNRGYKANKTTGLFEEAK